MKLIPHKLTPDQHVYGIRSLTGGGILVRTLTLLVLYLRDTFNRG
jgi:hypothetical protein